MMTKMKINMMVSLAVGGDIWATVEGGEGGSEGRDTQTHFNSDHDDGGDDHGDHGDHDDHGDDGDHCDVGDHRLEGGQGHRPDSLPSHSLKIWKLGR